MAALEFDAPKSRLELLLFRKRLFRGIHLIFLFKLFVIKID